MWTRTKLLAASFGTRVTGYSCGFSREQMWQCQGLSSLKALGLFWLKVSVMDSVLLSHKTWRSPATDWHERNPLQLQSFTLQQIVLRGIMQCCRLVGTGEFSAWIGTVGDWFAVSVGWVKVRSRRQEPQSKNSVAQCSPSSGWGWQSDVRMIGIEYIPN